MGFTITNSYQIPGSSLSASNLYITIRARSSSDKNRMNIGNQEPYIISSTYYILANKNDSKHLYEKQVLIMTDNIDNIGEYVPYIYNYLKNTTFNGLTCVDDL